MLPEHLCVKMILMIELKEEAAYSFQLWKRDQADGQLVSLVSAGQCKFN